MVRRLDQIDQSVSRWAATKRQLLGLTEQRGFLGPMRCTLAARRDLHAGAKAFGQVGQTWPEFPFRPGTDEWVINSAYRRMSEPLAEIVIAHWVVLEPRDKGIRAELMGLSRRVYWERVGRAKEFMAGALAGAASVPSESVRTLSPISGGI
jgi:hypothetical protein